MCRLKKWQRYLPLWSLILICVVVIALIGGLLLVFFGSERWFPALAYLVAASAIAAGGCVAYRHLTTLQGIERAHVLTHLDTCWSDVELANSRTEFLKFMNELCNTKDTPEWHYEIAGKLRTLKKDKYDMYKKLVSMLDFYETVGYFSRVHYILPNNHRTVWAKCQRLR